MGCNNNLTQNHNVVQPTARDLLGISSVNIKFSTELSHSSVEERIEPYNSKLLVIPTIRGSPYYHTSWEI